MEQRVIIMLIAVLLIGFYLELGWLVIATVALLIIGGFINAGRPGPGPAPKGAPEKIIYPVIYEDVGEPPYLYHPEPMVLYGKTWGPKDVKGRIGASLGGLARVAMGKALGPPKKEEKK